MVKVKRSFPAPTSLSKQKSYSEVDVVRQLKEDFDNKCYICNIDNLPEGVIEHLRPHKDGIYVDLKYDWENLFLSCRHCNSVKNKKIYEYKIIDCCKVDPEQYLIFNHIEENVTVKSLDDTDEDAVSTSKLITEVFNVSNTGHYTVNSEERRDRLQNEMNKLYKYLQRHKNNPDSKPILRTLKVLLQRKSPFAAFKRSYIRQNKEAYPNLQYLII
ncbi:MAG: hypothetical protein ATN35_05695 [Epulopiscium sp. Nele67-Bin004]|nr:MAG: hypothetical protein ATN35_05695 [Epulopiscium sp. Nele67-Bin004]